MKISTLGCLLLGALPCCVGSVPADRISLNSSDVIVWKVKPQAEVDATGVEFQQPNAPTGDWVTAVVPGTVFASFVAAGLEPDPNFADNIRRVSKEKYDRAFWYRTEFAVPVGYNQGQLWLNISGVNRDAEVFLNGRRLGQIQGIMQRGRFEIASLLAPTGRNALTVLVRPPQAPISNGGSPTYGSSGGWDWMPEVPGLNAGIPDDIFLTTTGPVSLIDPWIRAELPDLSRANLLIRTELENTSAQAQKGVLTGTITPGNIRFTVHVDVPARETKALLLDANGFPELVVKNPALWWPNGYGPANLYHCRLEYTVAGRVSAAKEITFGIRQLAVDTSTKAMRIVVNGVPIFARGGNWGMPEYLLRCGPPEYDTRVRLHQDMNFNIIRNWLGSTTSDAFYDACDRYGIMVWDDFWLNSSGGLPRDLNVFNANAVEKLKRLRNHPCIVLWCGENEGEPPAPLNEWLATDVKTFDGRHYHPNSHSDSLSGSGPWQPLEPKEYFLNAAPGSWGGENGWGMRSEIGTAVFVNLESLKRFIPPEKLWPRNEMWDQHYFGPAATYAGPDRYEGFLNDRYGKPAGIEEFCQKAQLLNLETTKAMFEGWGDNLWNDATGIIIWMSQSAYPSMVWQTYDYYLDATGAYWGAKQACEPIHIQWNCGTNSVNVINTTLTELTSVTAEARIYGLSGIELEALRQSAVIDVGKNSRSRCFKVAGNSGDLARKKPVTVSSVHVPSREGDKLTDGDDATRWESDYADQPWAYVDLGEPQRISKVILKWEAAFAKTYKLQVSTDARDWCDVYYGHDARGGVETAEFPAIEARYVRLFCIEKSSSYAVSLWTMEVYGDNPAIPGDVHFLRLRLTDRTGKLLSENLYWRGTKDLDFRGLNQLAPVALQVQTRRAELDGRTVLTAQITNPPPSATAAFAIHLQVIDPQTGERVLPVIASANYFTLMRGESREVTLEFAAPADVAHRAQLRVTPFNPVR